MNYYQSISEVIYLYFYCPGTSCTDVLKRETTITKISGNGGIYVIVMATGTNEGYGLSYINAHFYTLVLYSISRNTYIHLYILVWYMYYICMLSFLLSSLLLKFTSVCGPCLSSSVLKYVW